MQIFLLNYHAYILRKVTFSNEFNLTVGLHSNIFFHFSFNFIWLPSRYFKNETKIQKYKNGLYMILFKESFKFNLILNSSVQKVHRDIGCCIIFIKQVINHSLSREVAYKLYISRHKGPKYIFTSNTFWII